MLSADFVILAAIAYVGLLFVLAFISDARARRGEGGMLRSPFVYTLSISIYCTSWTFYGAVGTAARSGLEFLAIYLGPTLIFVGWWFVLRKLVRIGRIQRITSVADLLSSRYGKSNPLGVLATLIAIVSVTPYIALQLKAITTSIQVVSAADSASGRPLGGLDEMQLAFGVAAMMALFTILFGTRNVDAKEQHQGVVAAIAFEAIVKLLALLAVGAYVVFGVGGGLEEIHQRAQDAGVDVFSQSSFGSRWIALLVLSATAVLCLPRQFQITVVENADERHLRTAGWAFPTYLMLASLFTVPIALYGLTALPAGSNPDMFVLTIPMAGGQSGLALFAFIGGFSSATSMIIVAAIALSIMISNHILLPLMLRHTGAMQLTGDQGIARLLLKTRRIAIGIILLLGFIYFSLTARSDALAPIGLISFAGVAQFLPAMIAALYWREATLKGAFSGILSGSVIWAWTLFLPSFESSSAAVAALMQAGPWGLGFLRPQALFGLAGLDPLVHSVFWSLFVNTALLIVVSLLTQQSMLERLQATQFVDVFKHPAALESTLMRRAATASDLFFIAERVLGWERARAVRRRWRQRRRPARRAAGDAARLHRPAGARTGRLDRRCLGAHPAVQGGVRRGHVAGGDRRHRRRDAAGHRVLAATGEDLRGAAPDGRATAAGQHLAARPAPTEGRLPVADQPRGAHADDGDPLVLRDPAEGERTQRRAARALRCDHS